MVVKLKKGLSECRRRGMIEQKPLKHVEEEDTLRGHYTVCMVM